MHTGDVIKYLRKQKNMKQEELAHLLGVNKSSIQKYESGAVQNLKLEIIQKLCKIIDVAPFAFVFPKQWEKYNMPYIRNNDFIKSAVKPLALAMGI